MTKAKGVLGRVTEVEVRGKALRVEILPTGVWVWPSGRASEKYWVGWEAVWNLGAKLESIESRERNRSRG